MRIGVVKESVAGEKRVAMTPEVAKKLVGKGFSLLLEQGAGEAAHYHDDDYLAAGVELVERKAALNADIVMMVRKADLEDVAAMHDGAIYPAMLAKGIRPIAMEKIPRISRAQSMDALSSQSNIAGYRAAIEAAAQYKRFIPMMMTSAGSSKPARIVILGVGVAGLQAIATARRLGGDVYAYDLRPETKEQIESLGAKAIELDVGESGSGEGGYARELSDEAKARQQQLLADELAKAHIIITTALIPCRPAPVLIQEDVVKRMREGSVIIDLAAANGGNCSLTEKEQVVEKHGVILVGHTNYPSMMASDASAFYANNLFNLLGIMVDEGEEGLMLKELDEDEITKASLITSTD